MTDVRTPTSIDQIVGIRIRKARREAKLSQEALGELLGRTFQQIQKYEKGVNRVSAGVLFEVARVLNRELSWFFGESNVHRLPAHRNTDSIEFRECMSILTELRDSPSLGSVREVLRLAKKLSVVDASAAKYG